MVEIPNYLEIGRILEYLRVDSEAGFDPDNELVAINKLRLLVGLPPDSTTGDIIETAEEIMTDGDD